MKNNTRHGPGPWWPLALLAASAQAAAQSADTNVVTASADAFGVTIGIEALGLYSPGLVRGFDPVAAGNARIEGMYADLHGPTIPYGPLPARLIDNIRIRVGPAAAGFPFPAPTGIVDFSLRSPLGAAGVSPTVYVGPFGTSGFDLDAHTPVADGHCGVGAGITRRWDEFLPAVTQFTTDFGAIGACRLSDVSSFTVFYGRTTETRQTVVPTIYLTTAAPPEPFAARGTAPSWALGTVMLEDYGGLLTLEVPAHWTLRAGVFRSVDDQPNSGSDLLFDPGPGGMAVQQYVSYPEQLTDSTSGELRATHLTTTASRQTELIFTLRARDVTARYGGSDPVGLPDAVLGIPSVVPEPAFSYGALTRDHIEQWTAGAAYALHWKDVVDFAAGLEQVRYDRVIAAPSTAPVSSRETPLLYYASAGVPLDTHTAVYAALTRGLEDSGLAPASAANRGQLLPASRSGQEELGVRYVAGATTALVGLFEVYKPYYNVGSDGAYTWLGTENHRGLELSLNVAPLPGLTFVAGAVLMATKVDVARGAEGVGSSPVAIPRRLAQLAVDYRPPLWPRCSFDVTAAEQSREPVRLDDGAYIPAQTLVNVGARYRFRMTGRDATLRLQVQNVTERRVWAVIDTSGGLVPYPPLHMVVAYLSTDL